MTDIYFHITISHFLILAALLFAIGAIGVLVRRNALIVMMSIEIMLTAGILTVLSFARLHGDMGGHAFAFILIAIAAAEAAVGLAILVAVFRTKRHVDLERLTRLKH
jgi:NADH-quinone oxidoreductase subunit K